MLKALAISIGFCDTWDTYQGYAEITAVDNARSALKAATKIPVLVIGKTKQNLKSMIMCTYIYPYTHMYVYNSFYLKNLNK